MDHNKYIKCLSYRYCFVQLKPDADIDAVKQQISDIKFGTGRISVENKVTRHEVAEVHNRMRISVVIYSCRGNNYNCPLSFCTGDSRTT